MTELGLTEEQVAAIKNVFALYDRGGEGVILTRELGPILKALGHDLQHDELIDLINEVDFDGNGVIGIQDFMSIMVNKTKEDAFSSKLVDAFRVFDVKGKGFLDVDTVRHVFASMEEEMPDEEIDELLREANIDERNKIRYEELVKQIVR